MKVVVSAPGKIHLMGEHAVVYGKPALLAAINRRLSVTIESASTETSILVTDTSAQEYIAYALEAVKKEYRLDVLPALNLKVDSQIPFGYHLGSSAALAVATVGAVSFFAKKVWNPMEINRIAYEVEKKQHGNPSGGDNTAVTFGGFLWYRRELEFLKSMWQLPFHLPPELNHFFLINTGKPKETTGEMVSLVGEKVKKQKAKMENIFDENERQTRQVTTAIKENKEKDLIDAIQKGEQTLEAMGVVSEKAQPLIREIEEMGGAVKILGGGGKHDAVGFLLCYHHDLQRIESVCQPYGYSTELIRLAEEGVRLEK